MNETTGGLAQVSTGSVGSFYELYVNAFANPNGAGGFQDEIASRLLPRSLAETDPAKAAKIILSIDGGVTMK